MTLNFVIYNNTNINNVGYQNLKRIIIYSPSPLRPCSYYNLNTEQYSIRI